MPYVELHARSAFSFLRGGSLPEHLADRAAAIGLSALAICDRNGVYGAPRLFSKRKELGIRPLVGAELSMEDGSVIPVLVESRQGYQNLCRLITQAQLRSPKGESRVTWKELPEFAQGLIALTGDEEGPLCLPLAQNDRKGAEAAARRVIEAFGHRNVYVELQRQFRRGEKPLIRALCDLAEAHGLPTVATNGVLYASKSHSEILDVFTCIREHTHLEAAGRLLSFNEERHLKGPKEMAQLFADLPEAITNTERIADRLDFTLENLGYHFPEFPVPDGDSMDTFLRKRVLFGAQQRYGSISGPVKAQLDRELDLIGRLGFAGYFLIVWDIVNFAREQGILCQGRGSAANSAVCYALGITAVDPIGSKLLFERFLSEGRTAWPDIDLDFPSGDRREAIIQEVFRRYGKHGAAMTANVITYRGRSAMREIGKALNFPEDALKRFSDLFASGDFKHTLELEDQIVGAGIPRQHPRFAAAARLYQKIYGLPRHLGQHSGGMIICQGRLDNVVPLENASMPGRVVAQWDKEDCEELGIIKVDLLGLGMMAVMQDAITLTHQRGRGVDLAHIPKDDPETYRLLQRADTVGTFQVESRAQMATLPRMRPENFYHLVIEVAIIRPGPIVGNLKHPYLARRNGEQEIDYIHPLLKDTLERTLGVPLFQEQLLQIAIVLAGFDSAEVEQLRRAVGFHRSDERLKKVLVKLEARMIERGIEKQVRDRVMEASGSFALYGFPESHAISFALIAYASAWFKVHRAPEFYTALLNNQPMGFYSRGTLIQDGKKRGVQFRPVCIMRSGWECQIEEDASIRLGFSQVAGLNISKGAAIAEERAKRPFSSLADLLHRVPLNKAERRVLAKIGALNGLSEHRRTALWNVEGILPEDDLFSGLEGLVAPLVPMAPVERLQADYEGTGVTTGPHPMTLIRSNVPHVTRAKDLWKGRNGQEVTIAGMVICRQRPGTAKGHVFISLEDETGISNAIVRSETFERLRLVITHEPFLEIEGTLQLLEGTASILTKEVRSFCSPIEVGAQSYNFH